MYSSGRGIHIIPFINGWLVVTCEWLPVSSGSIMSKLEPLENKQLNFTLEC